MTLDLKGYTNIALLSLLGFMFYHASFFMDAFSNGIVNKVIAVMILLITIPLPVIAVHHKKVFKGLSQGVKQLIVILSIGTLFHHALMTFVLVMFTGNPS